MDAPTFPPFPDLNTIAFRNTDPSDHLGGGHCAGLPGGLLVGDWEMVLAQHITAFDFLVDKAAQEDGWALTRPTLFAAHHVSEVALKRAWVAHAGSAPKRGHHLAPLWDRLARGGGLSHLDPEQVNQACDFITFMSSLTKDGQSTRYPLPGEEDLGGVWCCINSHALREAVFAFITRLEPPKHI